MKARASLTDIANTIKRLNGEKERSATLFAEHCKMGGHIIQFGGYSLIRSKHKKKNIAKHSLLVESRHIASAPRHMSRSLGTLSTPRVHDIRDAMNRSSRGVRRNDTACTNNAMNPWRRTLTSLNERVHLRTDWHSSNTSNSFTEPHRVVRGVWQLWRKAFHACSSSDPILLFHDSAVRVPHLINHIFPDYAFPKHNLEDVLCVPST